MATTTATPVMDAIRERLLPALDEVEKNARRARHAVRESRFAAEDAVAGATLRVRQRPMTSMLTAAAAGALAGCVAGFMISRRGRARSSEDEECWC